MRAKVQDYFGICKFFCTFAAQYQKYVNMRRQFLLIISLITTLFISAQQPQFRAAWFSTVANIDWPSKEAIGNTALQKQEMIQLLDQMQALNLNAVIFQIRPTADALYPSKLEPWSHWLTGKQGQDNDVHYDPLAMMVTEAHKRGMDVHVWINPYRVTLNSQKIEDFGIQPSLSQSS